jgi:hypothetical protein
MVLPADIASPDMLVKELEFVALQVQGVRGRLQHLPACTTRGGLEGARTGQFTAIRLRPIADHTALQSGPRPGLPHANYHRYPWHVRLALAALLWAVLAVGACSLHHCTHVDMACAHQFAWPARYLPDVWLASPAGIRAASGAVARRVVCYHWTASQLGKAGREMGSASRQSYLGAHLSESALHHLEAPAVVPALHVGWPSRGGSRQSAVTSVPSQEPF